MTSPATTIAEYLKNLPDDRRDAINAVRKVILKNLDKGFEETMQYGMICYVVPHSIFPAGYHCDPRQALMYASLGSQKNYMAVYLMCVYGSKRIMEWFVEEYKKTGKKLDMGKSCVRFKKLEDLPLDLIGRTIAKVSVKAYLASYEAIRNKQDGKKAMSKSKLTKAKSTTAKK